MSDKLDATVDEVAFLMDKIVKHFKPGVKITVMVRTPDLPERDFSLSDDDPAEVIAMAGRRFGAFVSRPVSAEAPDPEDAP